jgi:hypothetical protein
MKDELARAAQKVPFRIGVAVLFIVGHLLLMRWMGDRYGVPFNAEPGQPPAFHDPSVDLVPSHWNRLVVSRWDSQHYIDLVLRGHSQCPRGGFLPHEPMTPFLYRCQLNFWPGYPFLGWLASLGGRLPADYVLFAISLVASFVFLFLWTGPTMVRALGVGGAYASLLAVNAHSNGFALVTVQTEPCLLALTLGSLLAMAEGRQLLSCFLAGAASGIRVSGVAVSVACGLAILVIAFKKPPRSAGDWGKLVGSGLLAAWGILVLMAYFWIRVRDPLAYVHAHAESYGHHPNILSLLNPETQWLKKSINDHLHAGLWVGSALLWLAIGHRDAFRGFSLPARVFCYALVAASMGVSVIGTIDLGLEGNTRYTLALLPVFFCIGAVLKNRPAGLAVWLALSFWFYRQVDLCHYVGGLGSERFAKCYDQEPR